MDFHYCLDRFRQVYRGKNCQIEAIVGEFKNIIITGADFLY